MDQKNQELTYVFVYGTLLRGLYNNLAQKLDQQVFIGSGQTVDSGIMHIYQTYLPMVDFNIQISPIKGEVFAVSSDKLKQLDRLESCDEVGGYAKVLIDVYLQSDDKDQRIPDGKIVKAYIYTRNYEDDDINSNEETVLRQYVHKGDYRKYIQSLPRKLQNQLITDQKYFN
eukprot:403371246